MAVKGLAATLPVMAPGARCRPPGLCDWLEADRIYCERLYPQLYRLTWDKEPQLPTRLPRTVTGGLRAPRELGSSVLKENASFMCFFKKNWCISSSICTFEHIYCLKLGTQFDLFNFKNSDNQPWNKRSACTWTGQRGKDCQTDTE